MKIAVISDIHANAAALERVLEHAIKKQGCEQIYILGDLIGYCANPAETLDILKKYLPICKMIFGNHEEMLFNYQRMFPGEKANIEFDEKVAIFKKNYSDIKIPAIEAAFKNIEDILNSIKKETYDWFFDFLDQENNSISKNIKIDGVETILSHGSILQRDICYVYPWRAGFAINSFEVEPLISGIEKFRISFLGHTHIPMIYKIEKDWDEKIVIPWKYGDQIPLKSGFFIINPGSVGFPRDEDIRASYLVFEVKEKIKTVTFFRLDYDRDLTEEMMIKKKYGMDTLRLWKTAKLPNDKIEEIYLNEMKSRAASPGE
jgi:predicted phosphodiesterase